MKKHYFSIFIFWLVSLPCIGQTVFKHTATSASINNNVTTISNPATDGKPGAILIVTPDYGSSGPYHAKAIGVWYSAGKWTIFNQDRSPMTANAKFNVMVLNPGANSFIHTATTAGISGHVTTIDHPRLNDRPNAKFLISQNWGSAGPYNNHPLGVYYSNGKWHIFNQNRAAIPVNAKFNVHIDDRIFVVQATIPSGNWFKFTNSSTDNKPNAFVFATQYWTGVYNPNEVGVWYNNNGWTVFNQNRSELPRNAKFNVLAMNEYIPLLNPDLASVDTSLIGTIRRSGRLQGFVDMHTHPMSHLSMGRKMMHGAPDGNIAEALGNCNANHGGWGFDNTGGDYIRAEVVNMMDEQYIYKAENAIHMDHPHDGFPNFQHWPHWSTVTHQQMWWEWIKRAHEGGLNVMVALAVQNSLITEAAGGDRDLLDDKSSVEAQLREMRRFVDNHSDFMEIALSPADTRRIVRSGKLAVVLGVETEDLGNLTRRKFFGGETITREKVITEIQNLYYNFDVRYILPIHLSNNIFGGTALADNKFLLVSKYYTNQFPEPMDSEGENINYFLGRENYDFIPANALRSRDLGWVIDSQPVYQRPAAGVDGQKNSLGLTVEGREAISEMMRLGMMIDIDHMSLEAVNQVLAMTSGRRNYPINSGHNGLRGTSGNENGRTIAQYQAIRDRGGMVGIGHGGNATNFVNGFRDLRNSVRDLAIGIGTDVNGFYPLPAPDASARVVYNTSFPQYSTARKHWDINVDGFAHYGLFPDFIKSWESAGMTAVEKEAFFSSAESFAHMWERCESRSREMFPTRNSRVMTIEPIYGLCPSTRVTGDTEFAGHGPRVWGTVTVRVNSSGSQLEAEISFNAKETSGDGSEVRGSKIVPIKSAPAGMRFSRITSTTSARFDQVLSGGGRNEVFEGCDGGEHSIRLTGNLINQMIVVGDTGGEDISTDADCNCDTRIVRIDLNPVTAELVPR